MPFLFTAVKLSGEKNSISNFYMSLYMDMYWKKTIDN